MQACLSEEVELVITASDSKQVTVTDNSDIQKDKMQYNHLTNSSINTFRLILLWKKMCGIKTKP